MSYDVRFGVKVEGMNGYIETMQEGGELSAEAILAMPHEKAVVVIDAIMADWFYWMRRAGEYFVQLAPQKGGGEDG